MRQGWIKVVLAGVLLAPLAGCGANDGGGTPEAEKNDPTNPTNISEQGGSGDSSGGGDSSAS